MSTHIPNSFQNPNAYVDRAMEHLTDPELRCLLFATRHIYGWQDKATKKIGVISLSMFQNGFTAENGQRYGGCGLGRGAIIKAVKGLVAFGFLVLEGKFTDKGQAYKIGEIILWEQLEQRTLQRQSDYKKKTVKATEKRLTGTSHVPPSDGTSHDTMLGTSDDTMLGTSHVHKQTHVSNPPSNPKTRAGARGVAKASKALQLKQEKLDKYDATLQKLCRKFKPDVDWTMIRPRDMYEKELERYIDAAEIFESFGLTADDLPGMFKYLDAKGWPSYGIGKIAECAPDYAGYKARQGAAKKIIQDNPALDLSTPVEVVPILMQREKIVSAAELVEDAS